MSVTTLEWRNHIQFHVAVLCIKYKHIHSFSSMSLSEVKLGALEVNCGCDETCCLVMTPAQMLSSFTIAHVPGATLALTTDTWRVRKVKVHHV
jgi:hypothetical protein